MRRALFWSVSLCHANRVYGGRRFDHTGTKNFTENCGCIYWSLLQGLVLIAGNSFAPGSKCELRRGKWFENISRYSKVFRCRCPGYLLHNSTMCIELKTLRPRYSTTKSIASSLPSSHGLPTYKIHLEAVKPPVILLAAVAKRNVEQGKAPEEKFRQDWYI